MKKHIAIFSLIIFVITMAFICLPNKKNQNSEDPVIAEIIDTEEVIVSVSEDLPKKSEDSKIDFGEISSQPQILAENNNPEIPPIINEEEEDSVIIEDPLRSIEDVFDYNGLVDITELSNDFVLDISYATTNNFTGVQHYEYPTALMQKDVAIMLIKAQVIAMQDGFRIRLYDTYRPLSVQGSLYDSTPPELEAFVAKPSKKEGHSIGISIDCGLSDMEGNEISMPSGFDEFNSSAYVDYSGGTEEQRQNRDYLISLMQSCGFKVYSKEWWHFNAPAPNGIEAMDISFEEFNRLRSESYSREQ